MDDTSGEQGLGTETGANEAGDQNPEFAPGATPDGDAVGGGQSTQSEEAPDNPTGEPSGGDEDAEPNQVPQEGQVEEDPDTAGDSN